MICEWKLKLILVSIFFIHFSKIYIYNINNEQNRIEYYASSNAKDMFYTKEDGTTVNLNDYIKELEGRVSNIENNLDSMIMDILKSVLVGTDKEIKVSENGGKMTIGFADDAIFGEN